MPVLKVFEIHTYRNGAWKIDSVFDDRDLAMMEAERMDRGNRYSAVRVVEETFDDETEKGNTRTIFRSSKAERINTATQARAQQGIKVAAPPPPPRPPKRKKSLVKQLVVASFAFAAIGGGGLVLIYFLNTLSGSGTH